MSKNGRNDPCACGSGKKYKRCHLPIEESARIRPHEAEGKLRKKISRARCMAKDRGLGDCSNKVIGAHTISKSSSLSRIAVDGHVYSTKVSFSDLEKSGGEIRPMRVGINKVSVFPGFCGFHDAELFRVVDAPLPKIDARFCEVAAFRAFSKELYLKEELISSEEDLRFFESGMRAAEWQFVRNLMTSLDTGRELAASELESYVASLSEVIAGRLESDWVHFVVRMKGATMPILVSAPFQPGVLPDGTQLQALGNLEVPCESVCISAVATDEGGAFVISCRSSDKKSMQFLDAVRSVDRELLPKFLIGLAFEMAENIAISPRWWDSLSAEHQDLIIVAMNSGVSPFSCASRESNAVEFNSIHFPGEFEFDFFAA